MIFACLALHSDQRCRVSSGHRSTTRFRPAAWRGVGWTNSSDQNSQASLFFFLTWSLPLSLSSEQDSQRRVSCPGPFTEPVTALPACGIDACRAISETNVTAAEGGGRTDRSTRTPGRAGLGGWDGTVDGQTCSVVDELIMQPHSLGGNMLRAVRNVMTFRPDGLDGMGEMKVVEFFFCLLFFSDLWDLNGP